MGLEMVLGRFLGLALVFFGVLASSARSGDLDDIPFEDVPRPGSPAELSAAVDHAIKVDRERRARIEAERKAWFADHATSGHSVRIFEDGAALTEARIALIRSAKRSVYLTTYAIYPDEAGKEIAGELCARAKEGLDVRLIINQMSSKNFTEEIQKLKRCGAYVLNVAQYLASIPYAVHQKLLIADGERFIIGGSGYTDSYKYASRFSHLAHKGTGIPWYDIDFEVAGGSACYFHNQFVSDWIQTAKAGLDYDPYLDRWESDMPGPRYGNMRPDDAKRAFERDFGMKKIASCAATPSTQPTSSAIPVYANPYFSKERPILEAHIRAVLASKYSGKTDIKLYAPFFVPGEDFVNALLWARKNGINVTLLTNSVMSSDNKMKTPIIVATIERCIPLVAAGVKVYFWNHKSTMHRKGGVVGSALSIVGSDNFDNRGQEYSSEAVLYSDDPELNRRLSEDFDRDIEGATLMNREYVAQFMKETGFVWKAIATLFAKYF